VNYIGIILEITRSTLSIWDSKQKRKYIDRFVKYQKELYEEESRSFDKRDQAVIDNLHFDIMLLSRAISSEINGQNSISES